MHIHIKSYKSFNSFIIMHDYATSWKNLCIVMHIYHANQTEKIYLNFLLILYEKSFYAWQQNKWSCINNLKTFDWWIQIYIILASFYPLFCISDIIFGASKSVCHGVQKSRCKWKNRPYISVFFFRERVKRERENEEKV